MPNIALALLFVVGSQLGQITATRPAGLPASPPVLTAASGRLTFALDGQPPALGDAAAVLDDGYFLSLARVVIVGQTHVTVRPDTVLDAARLVKPQLMLLPAVAPLPGSAVRGQVLTVDNGRVTLDHPAHLLQAGEWVILWQDGLPAARGAIEFDNDQVVTEPTPLFADATVRGGDAWTRLAQTDELGHAVLPTVSASRRGGDHAVLFVAPPARSAADPEAGQLALVGQIGQLRDSAGYLGAGEITAVGALFAEVRVPDAVCRTEPTIQPAATRGEAAASSPWVRVLPADWPHGVIFQLRGGSGDRPGEHGRQYALANIREEAGAKVGDSAILHRDNRVIGTLLIDAVKEEFIAGNVSPVAGVADDTVPADRWDQVSVQDPKLPAGRLVERLAGSTVWAADVAGAQAGEEVSPRLAVVYKDGRIGTATVLRGARSPTASDGRSLVVYVPHHLQPGTPEIGLFLSVAGTGPAANTDANTNRRP